MTTYRMAVCALAAGLALLVWSFIPGFGPQDTEFAGTTLVLEQDPRAPIKTVTARLKDSQEPALTLPPAQPAPDQTGPQKTHTVSLQDLAPGNYTLTLTRENRPLPDTLELQVLEQGLGILAAAGALLTILSAPVVLIRRSRLYAQVGKDHLPITGWAFLLMEPTGLSLARVQLMILFVPTAVVYLALAFPLHRFPAMPDNIWELLGIGGASAALSTLITPAGERTAKSALVTDEVAAALEYAPAGPQTPAALPAPAPDAEAATMAVSVKYPALSDLFAEGSAFGDISRYQSLVMCGTTAVVFFVSFFDTFTVPTIPDRVLQLLGTSLAVYLGVKGINVVKKQPG